jgi:hypothetical protein
MAMASVTNPQLPPTTVAQEPAVDASANKRKRDPSEPTSSETSHLSQTQSDILEIVQKYAR